MVNQSVWASQGTRFHKAQVSDRVVVKDHLRYPLRVAQHLDHGGLVVMAAQSKIMGSGLGSKMCTPFVATADTRLR